MNAKKHLVAAIGLITTFLALAAFLWQTRHVAHDSSADALSGLTGKFGPVIETVVSAAKVNGSVDMLDLESGRAVLQPPVEYFDWQVEAISTWIRTNGLDISCSVWPGGVACVTYGMPMVAVEEKYWAEGKEEELLGNPILSSRQHSPRRLLVMREGHANTYMFRTGEGTAGMLQILGLSQRGQGVKIRYKLIPPASGGSSVASRWSSE